jgi:uncharacterized protein YneF (UPF0154 family)
MKKTMTIPLTLYGLVFLGFFIYREKMKQYFSGNALLTMAAASLMIVAMLILLVKSEHIQKK